MNYFSKVKMYLIPNSSTRTKLIIKKKIFKSVGKNFFFQPRLIPAEPKLISFGDNVAVASDVKFITHDVIDKVLNNLGEDVTFNYYCAPIEVGNNVFIGSGTTILPNVKIGNNVIIAAGSIVNKDVKDGTIVGGNPAKEIGSFSEFVKKRKKNNSQIFYPISETDLDIIWKKFNNEKNNNN